MEGAGKGYFTVLPRRAYVSVILTADILGYGQADTVAALVDVVRLILTVKPLEKLIAVHAGSVLVTVAHGEAQTFSQ